MKKNRFSLLLILLTFLFFGENKNAEAVSVSCGYSPSSVISGKTTSTLQWRASEDVEELVVKCTNYSCSQSGGIGGGALCTYNGSGRGKTYTADEKSKVDGVFKGGFNISPTTWDDKGTGKSETCTFTPYGKNDPFGGRSCTATLSVSSNDDLRCNFSYGPNSVKSGEPVTVSWDFTGAQQVQFSCSNYKCDDNRCVYDPNGRSGDNFSSTKDSIRVATWDDLGTGASETCTFTVTGSNGQTKTCGDTLRIEKVTSAKGICGPAARTYYRNDPRGFESYGYTKKSDFCYFGNITNGFSKSSGKYKELSPSEVRFPSENVGEYHHETSYWSCEGPGIEKVNCSANLSSKREAINGECGVAAKNYLEEDGEFFREDTICGDHSKFCRKGIAEPAIINFPEKVKKFSGFARELMVVQIVQLAQLPELELPQKKMGNAEMRRGL
jgi:hypothetical protein